MFALLSICRQRGKYRDIPYILFCFRALTHDCTLVVFKSHLCDCFISLVLFFCFYFYQDYFEKMTSMEFKYACRLLKIYYLVFRLQGLILGPLLLNIFSNNLDGGAGQTLSRFAGLTKTGGLFGTPDDCAAVQWHVERLEILASKNVLKQSKGKCRDLPWGRKKPQVVTRAGWVVFGWKAALQ